MTYKNENTSKPLLSAERGGNKPKSIKLITKAKVCEILGISASTLSRRLTSDPTFPQARALGGRAVRFVQTEVEQYALTLPKVVYQDHGFDPNDGY
jgi:predicted DNA-binding transcriptional regulator AlpA